MTNEAMKKKAMAQFKRMIRAYGDDNVLDLAKYNSRLNVEKRPIVSIEYVEASDDILFHLNKEDDEDFTLFSDYCPATMYYASNLLHDEMIKVLNEKMNVVDLGIRLK